MSSPSESGRGLRSSSRVKRRLAVVSFLAALYPPVVVVVEALLSPLAHQQDIQVCKTFSTPSGVAKQYCEIQIASPLFGVFAVATSVIFVAILATPVSGHLALYHHQRAALTTSRRTLAIIRRVLGYAWAALAFIEIYIAPSLSQ